AVVTVAGEAMEVTSLSPATRDPGPDAEVDVTWVSGGEETGPIPLGRIVGARSGDKGGDANVGVWVRRREAFGWLAATLTVHEFRRLVPESEDLEVERHLFPNLGAINFVVRGLLGEGVASSSRLDPQAKSLGEYLRARLIDAPLALQG
ncbi:MAG: AtuA-related protein, partial [Acidimicrobiia bacterium]